MNTGIFLDDERTIDKDHDEPWFAACGCHRIERMTRAWQVIDFIEDNGYPTAISFDHDLGVDLHGSECMSGYKLALDILHRLIHEGYGQVPFHWRVHSANPVGHRNISAVFENFDSMVERMLDDDENKD